MCMISYEYLVAKHDLTVYRMHSVTHFEQKNEIQESSIFAGFKNKNIGIKIGEFNEKDTLGCHFFDAHSQAGWHAFVKFKDALATLTEYLTSLYGKSLRVSVNEFLAGTDNVVLKNKILDLIRDTFGFHEKRIAAMILKREPIRIKFKEFRDYEAYTEYFDIRPMIIPKNTLFVLGAVDASSLGANRPCVRSQVLKYPSPRKYFRLAVDHPDAARPFAGAKVNNEWR